MRTDLILTMYVCIIDYFIFSIIYNAYSFFSSKKMKMPKDIVQSKHALKEFKYIYGPLVNG